MEIASLELETYLLAGILRHPEVFPEMDGQITESDFTSPLHQTIFAVIRQTLHNKDNRNKLDKVLLAEKIERYALSFEDKISSVLDYLNNITLNQVKAAVVPEIARELKSISLRRFISQTVREADEKMFHTRETVPEKIIAEFDQTCSKIFNVYEPENNPVDLIKGAEPYIQSLDNDAPNQEIVSPYPIYQKFFGGFFPGDLTIFASSPKSGKALEENTPIATPKGFKLIKNLVVGDLVFSLDGNPTKVLAKQVWKNRPLYNITTSDRCNVIADADHEWVVRKNSRSKWINISSKTLASLCKKRPLTIPQNNSIQLPLIQLLIDPYVLGIWLGDGHSAGSRITQHPTDAKFLITEFQKRNTKLIPCAQRMIYKIPFLSHKLRELNLINNKHIPLIYLRSSESQRRDLLRGLIDTDGHVNYTGHIEYSTAKIDLAKQVLELLHSLGIKSRIHPHFSKKYNKYYYRIMFFDKNCCLLPRKRRKLKTFIKKTNRTIKSVPLYKKGNTVCIQVEHPSGIFLCGLGMIPTHNSTLLLDMLIKMSQNKEENVCGLIIDTELETYRVQRRMVSGLSGVNEYLIKSKKWRRDREMSAKIQEALRSIKKYFNKIDHIYVGNATTEEMVSIVRRWAWRKKIDAGKEKRSVKLIAAIDYFKLTGVDRIDDAFAASMHLGYRVDTFKKLASELQIPIIGACQTNRANEVGLSHEINKFVSSLFLFQRKSPDELLRDGAEARYKLLPLYTRDLGEYAQGVNNLIKVPGPKGREIWVENYIGFKIENFVVTEVSDLKHVHETIGQLNIIRKQKEDEGLV